MIDPWSSKHDQAWLEKKKEKSSTEGRGFLLSTVMTLNQEQNGILIASNHLASAFEVNLFEKNSPHSSARACIFMRNSVAYSPATREFKIHVKLEIPSVDNPNILAFCAQSLD